MAKLFKLFLTLALLAFTAPSQAQTPQQKPGAQGPNLSDSQKKTKPGKLPRKSEIDYLEERFQHLGSKVDPRISGGWRLPYRPKYAELLRERLARMDQLHGGLELSEIEAPTWFSAPFGPKYPGVLPERLPTLDYSSEVKILMDKWIPKYKKYLDKKFGTETSLSPGQLRAQVWNWLVPREKAELKAEIKRLEEGYARDLKSYDEIRDRLAKKKAELKRKIEADADDTSKRAEDIEKDKVKREETITARRPGGGETPNGSKDDGKPAADDDKRTRAEDIEKIKVKREETITARRPGGGGTLKPEAGEERIVEADEGGMLTGKALKLTDLEGCGAVFLKFDAAENFGWVSTSCPGLTGGRVATQADYLTYCNSFKRTRRHCGPPGPGTEKRIEISGIQGMPFSAFCLGLHFNILANRGDVFNSTVKRGKLVSVFKYDNGSRKLECYYVSFAQSKALRDQYKNIGKSSGPAGPVANVNPNKDCKSSGGLAGAANCVTKRIEGAGGSGAKTAGTPPDSASPTIKKGNAPSVKNAGKPPAWASSTDPNTGITIKSVANPDGSRTVTTTDKDGNILSREKVR